MGDMMGDGEIWQVGVAICRVLGCCAVLNGALSMLGGVPKAVGTFAVGAIFLWLAQGAVDERDQTYRVTDDEGGTTLFMMDPDQGPWQRMVLEQLVIGARSDGTVSEAEVRTMGDCLGELRRGRAVVFEVPAGEGAGRWKSPVPRAGGSWVHVGRWGRSTCTRVRARHARSRTTRRG